MIHNVQKSNMNTEKSRKQTNKNVQSILQVKMERRRFYNTIICELLPEHLSLPIFDVRLDKYQDEVGFVDHQEVGR